MLPSYQHSLTPTSTYIPTNIQKPFPSATPTLSPNPHLVRHGATFWQILSPHNIKFFRIICGLKGNHNLIVAFRFLKHTPVRSPSPSKSQLKINTCRELQRLLVPKINVEQTGSISRRCKALCTSNEGAEREQMLLIY